jgi:hypothetical protein
MSHVSEDCAYRVFVIKLEGKTPLVRHRHIGEDNIQMDLKKLWSVDWIQVAQSRHQRLSCEHNTEPPISIDTRNFLTSLAILASQGGFWSMELINLQRH